MGASVQDAGALTAAPISTRVLGSAKLAKPQHLHMGGAENEAMRVAYAQMETAQHGGKRTVLVINRTRADGALPLARGDQTEPTWLRHVAPPVQAPRRAAQR